jgi:hypothetical protein
MGRPPKKSPLEKSAVKSASSKNTPMVGFRMEPSLRDFLDKQAEKESRTFSNLALLVLTEWAKKRGYRP